MPSVVLIEDHTLVRELLCHLVRDELTLNLAGDAHSVADGQTLLLKTKPDLAILDWMLPDGRGFDLVRMLTPKLPGTRWLCISSQEQAHLVREAVRLGVHGFVLKRADLGTLRTAISRVLAGETYYCPQSASLLVSGLVREVHGTDLTSREREVLRAFAQGENPKSIAARLKVSQKTVQNHLVMLREKLGLREPAQLVHYAIKHGYIEMP